MKNIVAYLFTTLAGIVGTEEFALFIAALGLVAMAALLVRLVSRRS